MPKNTKEVTEEIFTGMEPVVEKPVEEVKETAPAVGITPEQIQQMIADAIKADRKAQKIDALAQQEAEEDVKKGKFARPDNKAFMERVANEEKTTIRLSPLLAQEVGSPYSFSLNGRTITLRVDKDTVVPVSVAKYWEKKKLNIEKHALPVSIDVQIN